MLCYRTSIFTVFPAFNHDDVLKYIKASPIESRTLDTIQTFLLKHCLDTVLPTIATIVNESLQQVYIPKELKAAIITPIPKKPKITDFSNFRPISNLPFISKLIERIAVDKLSEYCAENNLNEPYQSAYKKNHSCETALLEVFNQILNNMDGQNVTLLTLLDLSAAFDTVPHQRFLERLETIME